MPGCVFLSGETDEDHQAAGLGDSIGPWQGLVS